MLVDLNGLYPEWLDGIYAHIEFELLFLLMYSKSYQYRYADNIYGKANVYIPGGGKTGGKGFADVVLYMDSDVYIYEIKPQSYYDDPYKKKSGEAQLQRYIDAYNNNNNIDRALHGSMNYVDQILSRQFVFWFDTKRTIVYEMYDGSSGMIYYKFEDKSGQQKKESELIEMMEKLLPAVFMTSVIFARVMAKSEEFLYEEQQKGYGLDEETQKFLEILLMSSAATAEYAGAIGECVISALFFLFIPQTELDIFQQNLTGNCQA